MAPYINIPLSPAELSYLHTSLASDPPIRPDGRSSTQFRPLIAETDILPSANGSARICFADGTEAVVGVKAEVEKSKANGFSNLRGVSGEVAAEGSLGLGTGGGGEDESMDSDEEDGGVGLELGEDGGKGRGEDEWLELSIEIPGMRDDDALPVFLAAMLREALLAERGLQDRLWMNRRFHWRLYIDVCDDEKRAIVLHACVETTLLDAAEFLGFHAFRKPLEQHVRDHAEAPTQSFVHLEHLRDGLLDHKADLNTSRHGLLYCVLEKLSANITCFREKAHHRES